MRLPLLPSADLDAAQRALYEAYDSMTQGEEYQGFEVKNSDGAFVGPWGVMLHFPDLARPLGQFIDLAQRLPGLSERARQVVILTIGGRFNVAYELYAHIPLAERAGLRPDQVGGAERGLPAPPTSARTSCWPPTSRALVGVAASRPAVRNRRREARPGGPRRDRVHLHPLPGPRHRAQRLRRPRRKRPVAAATEYSWRHSRCSALEKLLDSSDFGTFGRYRRRRSPRCGRRCARPTTSP